MDFPYDPKGWLTAAVQEYLDGLCPEEGSYRLDEQFAEEQATELGVILQSTLAPMRRTSVEELTACVFEEAPQFQLRLYFGPALQKAATAAGDERCTARLRHLERLTGNLACNELFSLRIGPNGIIEQPAFVLQALAGQLPPQVAWLSTEVQEPTDEEILHNDYRSFIDALAILASPPEAQCAGMGYCNVAWELVDLVYAGRCVLGGWFLGLDEEIAVFDFTDALKAVPESVLAAATGRKANLQAMSHKCWIPLRKQAKELLHLLSPFSQENARFLGLTQKGD